MSGEPDTAAGAGHAGPPAIAGFWRRIAAAAVDSAVLGVFGHGLGLIWFGELAQLGGSGRLLGGSIALVYLGILNSRVGRGQTLGKRAVGIRVVDAAGSTLPVSRSTLRSGVLLLPLTLNGFYAPSAEGSSLVLAALGLCVFGLGGALVYLYVFNRRTRQSVHDLAAGSFVVAARHSGAIRARIWRPHLAVAAGWALVVTAGIAPLAALMAGSETFRGLAALQRDIEGVVPGARIAIADETTIVAPLQAEPSTTRRFAVKVLAPVEPASYEELADRIAEAALRSHPDIREVAQLSVSISYGYDIFISAMHTSRTFARSPREWDERLRLRAPSGSPT